MTTEPRTRWSDAKRVARVIAANGIHVSPFAYESGGKPGAPDAFTEAYIDALLFTEAGTDGEIEGADLEDFSPELWKQIRRDCALFQEEAARLLATAAEHHDYSEEQASHDFWLTRNGHGAGFWDRGLGDVGDKLTDRCAGMECWIYRGDDNLIYQA